MKYIRRIQSKWLRRFAWIMALWIPASWPLADFLASGLEMRWQPIPVAEVPDADAVVVLGGGVKGLGPTGVLPVLRRGASRYWYAARLYHAGKVRVIVAVGGNARPDADIRAESASIAEFLEDLGVPRGAILQEPRSRTTVENALFVKPLLVTHGIRRVLLVTSSLHMPRAAAIFRAVGIDAVLISTDADAVYRRKYTWVDFLPNIGALERTLRALHEYIGLLVYPVQLRLAGNGSADMNHSQRP